MTNHRFVAAALAQCADQVAGNPMTWWQALITVSAIIGMSVLVVVLLLGRR